LFINTLLLFLLAIIHQIAYLCVSTAYGVELQRKPLLADIRHDLNCDIRPGFNSSKNGSGSSVISHFYKVKYESAAGLFFFFFVVICCGYSQSWVRQQSNTNADLYSIFFPNPDSGFASGSNGVILKTSNSGLGNITSNKDETNFSIFPNPFFNRVTIEMLNYTNKGEIYIYTLLGTLIFTQELLKPATSLDLSFLEPGIYFAELKIGRGSGIVRLIGL